MEIALLRRIVRAFALLTCAAGPAFGQAAVPRVRLEYERKEGAASCPDRETLQAGVAARLGYEPFDDAAADRVRATVQLNGRVLEARVEIIDAGGEAKAERRLVSRQRDCAQLASAVELAISIAIDPFRAGHPAAPPAESAPVPPPATPPVVAESPLPAPAPAPLPPPLSPVIATPRVYRPAPRPAAPPPPITGEIALGVLGGIGAAPERTVGVVARAGLRRRDLSLDLEGRADLSTTVPLRVGDVRTSLLVASLVPCLHVRALRFCGLIPAGALRASGHGLLEARQVVLPWVALGARVYLVIPMTRRLALAFQTDVAAPLTATELRVDGSELWTSSPVSVTLGVGVAVSFP